MSANADRSTAGPAAWPRGLERDAARDLLSAGVLVMSCAAAAQTLAGFEASYMLRVAMLFAACTALVWRGLRMAHPHPKVGPANRITLARMGVASLLAPVIGQHIVNPVNVAWVIVVVATASALLDLADGSLARRSGLASDFGARFDMETDAWFTLVLCSLIVFFGKAGVFVLAAGAMRYVFVLAARVWPWLSAPLPPSTRRKAVCVAQITMLIMCLGPIIPYWASSTLAAASLVMVSWSFLVDVLALRSSHLSGVPLR